MGAIHICVYMVPPHEPTFFDGFKHIKQSLQAKHDRISQASSTYHLYESMWTRKRRNSVHFSGIFWNLESSKNPGPWLVQLWDFWKCRNLELVFPTKNCNSSLIP